MSASNCKQSPERANNPATPLHSSVSLGRVAFVVTEQSAEEAPTAHAPDILQRNRRLVRQLLRTGHCIGQRAISEPLVRLVPIEEPHVLLPDVVEVPQAEAGELIQALAFDDSANAFASGASSGVRMRRTPAAVLEAYGLARQDAVRISEDCCERTLRGRDGGRNLKSVRL